MTPIRFIISYVVFFLIHGFFYAIVLNFNHDLQYQKHYLTITIQNQEQEITELLLNNNYDNHFKSMNNYQKLKKKNNKK